MYFVTHISLFSAVPETRCGSLVPTFYCMHFFIVSWNVFPISTIVWFRRYILNKIGCYAEKQCNVRDSCVPCRFSPSCGIQGLASVQYRRFGPAWARQWKELLQLNLLKDERLKQFKSASLYSLISPKVLQFPLGGNSTLVAKPCSR